MKKGKKHWHLEGLAELNALAFRLQVGQHHRHHQAPEWGIANLTHLHPHKIILFNSRIFF